MDQRCAAIENPPCLGEVVSKGYCSKHYTRFRKHGDASVVLEKNANAIPPRERFDSKYLVDESTGCWMWTGAANGHGWATISIDGRATMAHRYAYEEFVGPVPENHSVRRSCGRGACVNPEHMILVSNDPIDRFWDKVDKQDDHWVWMGVGFVFRVNGKPVSPRRFAWNLVNSEDLSKDETLYALCGNDRCVNPEHSGSAVGRFWARVEKNPDGCWYWQGSKLPSGYPHLTYDGHSVYAHRLTYEWAGGTLEDGYVLSHTCGHLDCVNPKHLEQISYEEMVRLREKNRIPAPCPKCGKVYRSLKAHMRIHENRPKETCPECGKGFKSLKVHSRIHLNIS